jgi:hypothetical protein
VVGSDVSGAPIEEHDYLAVLRETRGAEVKLTDDALSLECQGCGSVVTFLPPQVAGSCPFCAAPAIGDAKAAAPALKPESLLPFSVTREKATENVRGWINGLWFAPNALKRQCSPSALTGMYLPFWAYGAHTESDYLGQRGDYYYEAERYQVEENGQRVTKTREVRKTRWTPASGHTSAEFREVLIAAANSLSGPKLNSLGPWPLAELKPFDPQYLAGYQAQRYQVNLEAGFAQARAVMDTTISGNVRAAIGGNEQRIESVRTAYSEIAFKHLLLPVWLTRYRFSGKTYEVLVNARTGEVQGDRPYSVWKIAFAVLLVAALAVLAWYFSQHSQG